MNFKLDTAKIGREKGSAPANWVEKCSCPKAYVGDYCEECAPGFKHEPANGGPYSTCIPCDCNGHAHICDTATGMLKYFDILHGFKLNSLVHKMLNFRLLYL